MVTYSNLPNPKISPSHPIASVPTHQLKEGGKERKEMTPKSWTYPQLYRLARSAKYL